MEEIKRQVTRAQWRLNFQQILAWLPWTLFVSLFVAAIGVAIPKIWVVNADPNVWFYSWLAGSVAAGLFAGLIFAYVHRRGALEAAIELDRRFGLKERVSTTFALSPAERESEIGQALVKDAIRRVERVEVAEQFPVQLRRPALLPAVPILIIIGLFFLQNSQPTVATATNATNAAQVKKSIERLAEKLKATANKTQSKEKDDEALKDAKELQQVSKKLEDLLKKPPTDQKDALIKLNDLAKSIEEQKKNLPNKEDLKQQFNKMQEMNKGPADKLAEALKDGDLSKAQKELENLKEQLSKGEMSAQDKEKLGNQLEKMKEKIQEAKQAREQAKEDLKKQIEQKKAEGNQAEAGELQQKLEEMEAQDKQVQEKMDKMAEKFGDVAKALQDPNADPKDAAAKMEELAGDLQELQEQLQEAEQLDEMMESLADAKNSMKCDKCQGSGCEECNGEGDQQGKDGKGKGKGNKPGNGMGEGQGFGNRPEEENDYNTYESRVRADAKKGESVRIGDAGGPNVAGRTREEVKAEIRATQSADPDALEDGALSREQKEHAKQYFQQLRDGK